MATLQRRSQGAAAALLALSTHLTACRGSETSIIAVDGSSTVFPITEAVAEEFQRGGGTAVTVGISGTGGGFQKFCRDEIDISDASRPIEENEQKDCAAAGVQFVELPVAYDGLAVVVHAKNTWAASMTIQELRKLWEPAAQGTVTRWSQVRGGWPDQEIHLFGAGVDSGTFDYFTQAIMGKEDASRGDYTSSEDDNVIVQGVAGDEYALGYFGYAYYEGNKDKLKLVAIDDGDDSNGKGPILPSPETVTDGTYSPLSRPIFIYPKVKALERPDVKRFVDFYLAQAPSLVREVGYIPLREGEYQLVRQRFASGKTGSMYQGTTSQSRVTLEQRLSQ